MVFDPAEFEFEVRIFLRPIKFEQLKDQEFNEHYRRLGDLIDFESALGTILMAILGDLIKLDWI